MGGWGAIARIRVWKLFASRSGVSGSSTRRGELRVGSGRYIGASEVAEFAYCRRS